MHNIFKRVCASFHEIFRYSEFLNALKLMPDYWMYMIEGCWICDYQLLIKRNLSSLKRLMSFARYCVRSFYKRIAFFLNKFWFIAIVSNFRLIKQNIEKNWEMCKPTQKGFIQASVAVFSRHCLVYFMSLTSMVHY